MLLPAVRPYLATRFLVFSTPTAMRRSSRISVQAASKSDQTALKPKTKKRRALIKDEVELVDAPKKIRKIDPTSTNAPLKEASGSRLVKKTYASDVFEKLAPSKPAATTAKATITTENVIEKACAHLCAVEPKLATLIEQHPCPLFTVEGLAEHVDPFVALSTSIMSQQVSGAAAASIKRKFIDFFPRPNTVAEDGYFPAANEVAVAKIEQLRTAGLSQRKAEYIQGLASKFASGELSGHLLLAASDEELLEQLTAVRGLGRWSVEMFAVFALKRMNIFSSGDLGVQRGMAAFVGKDVAKLKAKKASGAAAKWKYMDEKSMLDIAERFAPYKSLFMWYMWRLS